MSVFIYILNEQFLTFEIDLDYFLNNNIVNKYILIITVNSKFDGQFK